MDSICCAERLEDYLHKKNGHYAMLCCVVLCCGAVWCAVQCFCVVCFVAISIAENLKNLN